MVLSNELKKLIEEDESFDDGLALGLDDLRNTRELLVKGLNELFGGNVGYCFHADCRATRKVDSKTYYLVLPLSDSRIEVKFKECGHIRNYRIK